MRYPARCAAAVLCTISLTALLYAAFCAGGLESWRAPQPEKITIQRAEKSYGDVECIAGTITDGDTFHVTIPGWPEIIGDNISVRVRGIDTPEKHDPDPKVRELANRGRIFVVHQVRSGAKVELKNMGRDKYFRIDADVYVGEQSLAQLLLDNYLAKPYDGGAKPVWTAVDFQKYSANKK
jgi:micrococcal nuclease